MEISIFMNDGEIWTRFRVRVKELQIYSPLLRKFVDIKKPVKQNNQYIYFEVKGDLLNN